MNKRIKKVFENEQKKLVTFVTGCDPDFDTSKKINYLPVCANGAKNFTIAGISKSTVIKRTA